MHSRRDAACRVSAAERDGASPFSTDDSFGAHSSMSIAEKFISMEYGPAPEDSKEATAWLERHDYRFLHFIGGGWREPAAGEYFDTIDPSNGEKLASIAQGSSADVDAAVKAARA